MLHPRRCTGHCCCLSCSRFLLGVLFQIAYLQSVCQQMKEMTKMVKGLPEPMKQGVKYFQEYAQTRYVCAYVRMCVHVHTWSLIRSTPYLSFSHMHIHSYMYTQVYALRVCMYVRITYTLHALYVQYTCLVPTYV